MGYFFVLNILLNYLTILYNISHNGLFNGPQHIILQDGYNITYIVYNSIIHLNMLATVCPVQPWISKNIKGILLHSV